jgi:hypothetical protein
METQEIAGRRPMGTPMTPPRSPVEAERRAAARYSVAYRLDVSVPDGNAGCLLDISTTGMRVRFRHAFDLATTTRLRIEFPRWLELGSHLEVGGRFVWLRSGPSGTEAGFAFDGLSRKELSVLQVLIQRLTEAQLEDRPQAA